MCNKHEMRINAMAVLHVCTVNIYCNDYMYDTAYTSF